jgi:hypothetical protein
MSKFLEIGVNKQYSATSIRQAEYFYNQSCYLCITRGRQARCENCPIACANANVIQIFNSMAPKKSTCKCA